MRLPLAPSAGSRADWLVPADLSSARLSGNLEEVPGETPWRAIKTPTIARTTTNPDWAAVSRMYG